MEWWHPKQLKEDEEKIRSINEVTALDPKSDFGSYRRMLLGDDPERTMIANHNDVQPLRKVQTIVRSLGLNLGLNKAGNILDAGCGLGFTTVALAQCFKDAKVLGIDISADAVAYASARYPAAEFKAEAISPDAGPLGRFDLIFCFEFYPFTRNADAPAQASFIRYFADQLNEAGLIVIYQAWNNPQSLSAILEDVKRLCPGLFFKIHDIPHPRLSGWLPQSIAVLCSRLMELTGREGVKRLLTVEVLTPRGQ